MICNIFHYLQPYHLPQNQPGALCFPEGVLFCPAALQIYLPMTSLLCSRFSAEWKSREICDRFLKTGSFIFTLRVNYIFLSSTKALKPHWPPYCPSNMPTILHSRVLILCTPFRKALSSGILMFLSLPFYLDFHTKVTSSDTALIILFKVLYNEILSYYLLHYLFI